MKPEARKVIITCTEKQLTMLSMVCDRYARLIEGQLENSLQEVCEQAWERRNKSEGSNDDWYAMREHLESTLKEMEYDYWGLSGGSYNGIGYDDWADTLWDMHQVMRHARYLHLPAKEQDLLRITVDAHDAMRTGSEPLIEVKYEED